MENLAYFHSASVNKLLKKLTTTSNNLKLDRVSFPLLLMLSFYLILGLAAPSKVLSKTSQQLSPVRVPRDIVYREIALSVTVQERMNVQRALANRGYYQGAIDGIYGSGTRAAIKAFQRDHRLDADGLVGNQTLRALGLLSTPTPTSNTPARRENLRYVVIIPDPDPGDLARVQPLFTDIATWERSRRGSFIRAGAFNTRDLAEARSYLLQNNGFDARVIYF